MENEVSKPSHLLACLTDLDLKEESRRASRREG